MKPGTNKIFNKTVAKRFAIVIAGLLLAALTTFAVLGYNHFKSLQEKVSSIDTRLSEFIAGPAESNEEVDSGSIEYVLAKQEVRTVGSSTEYDQTEQKYIYEPTEVLEVTLDVTNGTEYLYDSAMTRIFAETAGGTLVSDDRYSINENDVRGEQSLTLAPNGKGKLVLYFIVGDKEFSSIFVDDSGNFGKTYSLDL